MKLTNILIFICIIFCLFGCEKQHQEYYNSLGTVLYSDMRTLCVILKHEGHDYILARYAGSGIEIVHSESCSCIKGKELNEIYKKDNVQ